MSLTEVFVKHLSFNAYRPVVLVYSVPESNRNLGLYAIQIILQRDLRAPQYKHMTHSYRFLYVVVQQFR